MENKPKKKQVPDPFNQGVEDEFQKVELQMEEEVRRMMEDVMSLHKRNKDLLTKAPFVYGFSIKMSQDGKPEVRQFGNVRTEKTGSHSHTGEKKEELLPEFSREPLVDLIEEPKEITVIAELPGAKKDSIRLNSTENSLSVDAKLHNVGYHRDVALPAKVDPKSAKATYKNGVLEVKLKRTQPGQSTKNPIKVE